MGPLFVSAFAASLGASFFLTRGAIRLAHRVGAIDWPGHRKMHSKPVAYLGGLGLIGGMACGLALLLATDIRTMDGSFDLLALAACVVTALAAGIVGL